MQTGSADDGDQFGTDQRRLRWVGRLRRHTKRLVAGLLTLAVVGSGLALAGFLFFTYTEPVLFALLVGVVLAAAYGVGTAVEGVGVLNREEP
ncbi:hypothetical protein ACFO0N_02625 [Halobium salinum]|uniref:Major facilitator superfamily (MFS) profile domain-containing protein n=1 Tax=Halobium salinum TaxID=1364940 RepID=A0ABD5P7H4_9EURY|nr:hypothetical protein [Halobium salinum]